jgi:16S rRNA (cytosine967-C5)-methyltransferase
MLVGARAGERVLDACAGRGNKTLALIDFTAGASPPVEVQAADQHPDKLDRLAAELRRVGAAPIATHPIDWSVGIGDVPEASFDRVLVDAPCSGVGTLRRRPEIQSRRQAVDLEELSALQLRIVGNAARVVKPGGRLFYAVCSVLRDETEGVVHAVLAAHPELKLAPFDAVDVDGQPLADRLFGAGATQGRLLTHVHGTDGYFVASFVKSS